MFWTGFLPHSSSLSLCHFLSFIQVHATQLLFFCILEPVGWFGSGFSSIDALTTIDILQMLCSYCQLSCLWMCDVSWVYMFILVFISVWEWFLFYWILHCTKIGFLMADIGLQCQIWLRFTFVWEIHQDCWANWFMFEYVSIIAWLVLTPQVLTWWGIIFCFQIRKWLHMTHSCANLFGHYNNVWIISFSALLLFLFRISFCMCSYANKNPKSLFIKAA